jgi:hypothetical protein
LIARIAAPGSAAEDLAQPTDVMFGSNQIAGLYERGAGQAVEARDGAGRRGNIPNRVGDARAVLSPLMSVWTPSAAARVD